ncbi:peptidyl-prolyl isomerase G (cyclophilin G) [Cryptococcus deuterogattii LA55]|nr:peptidyl-prolyl isomerase G (cyclophilin G) [Cryptococcus deuterogattii LA55]KIR90880.1 peptidyl-prolyl isomerase G (cyclophilin G) [Cryptococcus deuterogattii CBS 10090]
MAHNPRVFFDFAVAGQPLGRVVFELYANVFRALCTGEKGISPISSVPLHYKNSIVHRVIEGFMIQGGDFTKKTGAGGESIFGAPFEDERLDGEGCDVDKKGLLVMANRGPNTNGSQYFITLAPAPHLTGKHVVFGRVVFGMEHIDTIGQLPTDDRDRPLSPVTIIHCGELELRRPPPKPRARSASISSSFSDRSRSRSRSRSPSRNRSRDASSPDRSASTKRRSRSRKYSDSGSESDYDSDDSRERRRRRKDRKRSKRSKSKSKSKSKSRRLSRGRDSESEREETLSELDARLEREEKEKLEKERLEKLAEMKRKIEEEKQRVKDAGGVIYKGRGAMKYLDPETINRQQLPQNFNIRGGRGRGDLPPPRGGSFRDRDRDRERYGDRDGGQERRDRREQRGDRGDHDRGYPSSYSRSDPYSRRTRDPLDRYPRPTGRENGQEDRRTKLDRDMDQWQHDRSQGLDVRGERDKFRRGERDEPERDREEKREEKKEEGEMTPRDEKERSSGLEREDRVERAMSEGSDMVMDRDD